MFVAVGRGVLVGVAVAAGFRVLVGTAVAVGFGVLVGTAVAVGFGVFVGTAVTAGAAAVERVEPRICEIPDVPDEFENRPVRAGEPPPFITKKSPAQRAAAAITGIAVR